jgi:hypothetical protein
MCLGVKYHVTVTGEGLQVMKYVHCLHIVVVVGKYTAIFFFFFGGGGKGCTLRGFLRVESSLGGEFLTSFHQKGISKGRF